MGTNLNMGFYILLCFFTGSKLSDDRYEQDQCNIKEYGKIVSCVCCDGKTDFSSINRKLTIFVK